MRSIQENVQWVTKTRRLPEGYTWAYVCELNQFDKLVILNPKGKRVLETFITRLSDNARWGFAADRLLHQIVEIAMREQYLNPPLGNTKLEDLGEKPERKAIEAPVKDKTKGFWGWLYK